MLVVWSMQTQKDSPSPEELRAMREANQLPRSSIVDIDPEDPLQQLDDAGQFSIVPLAVEVQSEADAEADDDFAALEVAAEEEEVDEDAGFFEVEVEAVTKDTGDLYGVRTPTATDRHIETTADREEYLESDQGENWLETLAKAASEGGVEPEEDVRPVDDSDEHIDHRGHSATDHRDRPVADRGSGGPGGL